MKNLSASYLFSGMSDYWGGHSSRGHNGGCAFAYYGRDTTLKDLVDQWVDETCDNEHDFGELPESVSQDDIRACILESFTDAGRADYESGAVCEFSEEYDDCNPEACADCGELLGEEHKEDCDASCEDNDGMVVEEDCERLDDCYESPVAIMLIEWTLCEDCPEMADPDGHDENLCSACNAKWYGGLGL